MSPHVRLKDSRFNSVEAERYCGVHFDKNDGKSFGNQDENPHRPHKLQKHEQRPSIEKNTRVSRSNNDDGKSVC